MKKIGFIPAIFLLIFSFSCNKTKVENDPDPDPVTMVAKPDLTGTWKSTFVEVKIHSIHGKNKDSLISAKANEYPEKLGINANWSTMYADSTFEDTYISLADTVLAKGNGRWYFKGDSIVFHQASPTDRAHVYAFTYADDIMEVRGLVDWDQDGAKDDEFYGGSERLVEAARNYVMVTLSKGEGGENLSAEEKENLQEQHLRYIRTQSRVGNYVLTGPFNDQDNPRGIIIMPVESVEDAQKIVEADPMLQAGVLKAAYRSWYGPTRLENSLP